jgi:ABC-type glycerol-3-phosphate transport system substrate-binding protein
MSATIARRRLLLAIGAGGGAALLAACGASTPTAVPQSQTIIPASKASTPAAAPAAASPGATPAASTAATPAAGTGATPAAPAPGAPAPGTPAGTAAPAAEKKQIEQNLEPGAPPPDLVAKPPSGKPQITLRFHMRTGGEKTEQSIYVFRPTEWEEQTGHKVKLEPSPGDANYVPKLLTQVASGTAGDLTWSSDGSNEYRHLARNGALEPLDDTLKTFKISKDEWRKAVIEQLSIEGKQYGSPKAGYAAYSWIWVNLKMFKEAGLPEPPTTGVTFEQIRDWANKLAKGPKDKRDVYGYYSELNGHQQITNASRQFGADIVDKDGTSSLVDRPEFVEWLKWNHQLIVQDGVVPLSSTIPNNNVAAMFAAQRVAMAHGDRSFHFLVRNAVKDFDFATIQFPRGPKAVGWGAVCSAHCALSGSKYKDEAGTLTYAIGDKRFAFLVGKFNGYLVGRANNLEELGPYANDPFIQLQYKSETQTAPYWTPKNLRTFEISAALTSGLDNVWLGKRQPDQAFATELKKTLDEILAKPL